MTGRYDVISFVRACKLLRIVTSNAITPIANHPVTGERLRVLDISFNYPHIAESYIDAEIRQLVALGAEVVAWSHVPAPAPGPTPPGVRSFVGVPLAQLVAEFKPHVVHFHWMLWGEDVLDSMHSMGLPVTVRVHTDSTRERLQMYCAHPAVRRVYTYPMDDIRFDFQHEKCSPMPVVVSRPPDSLGVARDRRLVLRAASLSPRDQHEFVLLARKLPDFQFVICMAENRHIGAQDTINAVFDASLPPIPNLQILWNVPPDEMARWYARAGIYLHTFPAGKIAAMPVSIGQALIAGCYTIVRNQPRLAAMIGNAGATYETYDDAVELIEQTQHWDDARWAAEENAARAEGERYCADQSIRTMVNDWQDCLRS